MTWRTPEQTAQARAQRRNMSKAEVYLWQRLRGKQTGYRFTRQLPVGPYLLDFACRMRRIAVEVDGDHHADRIDADRVRTRWLAAHGWRVLRVSAREVVQRPDEVANWVTAILDGLVDAHDAMAWHPAEPEKGGVAAARAPSPAPP